MMHIMFRKNEIINKKNDIYKCIVYWNFPWKWRINFDAPYHAEPCSSYTLISGQYKRSIVYTIKSTDIAVSDNFLSEGWYRFDSGAGNDMVTQAPTVTQCGTIFPIWMQGLCQFKEWIRGIIVLDEILVLNWF